LVKHVLKLIGLVPIPEQLILVTSKLLLDEFVLHDSVVFKVTVEGRGDF
jgi:hypothetical protein